MANKNLKTRIVLRKDTEANWLANDPVLLAGEPAIVVDKRQIKFGDGASKFSALKVVNVTPEEFAAKVAELEQATQVLEGKLFGEDGHIKDELINFPATSVDEKSITSKGGVLGLYGFDKVTEEGYQLVTKNVEGQLRIVWQKPDTSTVDGLSTAVESLQNEIKTTVKVTDIATAEKAGIVKSQAEGVGHVVVAGDGTMSVAEVAQAQHAAAADDASKLGGQLPAYYATAEALNGVKATADGAAKDLTDLKAGTLKAPEAVHAEKADKLNAPVNVSASGDVNAAAVQFDGSGDIVLATVLKDVISAGSGCKVTVDAKGRVTALEALTEADIPQLAHTKITGLGSAAVKDAGIAAGNVLVVAEDGKIDASVLPAIAVTDVYEAADEKAMLALNAQQGDIAIRSDLSKSFILAGNDPKVKDNWKELKTPTDAVLSVNGMTGAVTLSTDNVAEGSANLYYTEERAAAAFTANFGKASSTSLVDSDNLLRADDVLILDGGSSL